MLRKPNPLWAADRKAPEESGGHVTGGGASKTREEDATSLVDAEAKSDHVGRMTARRGGVLPLTRGSTEALEEFAAYVAEEGLLDDVVVRSGLHASSMGGC